MDAGRNGRGPQHPQDDTQAAGGGPFGVGHPTYAERAEELLELGYEPLPIIPGLKRPAPKQWTTLTIDADRVQGWTRQYPVHGIGLRTGTLVGVDIDILDADLAHQIHALAVRRFGATLMRVGLWPKRLLLYRTEAPFQKLKLGDVEILGAGQQFVGFGIHPKTHQPYHWPDGDTPLDVALNDLPLIDADMAASFLAEAAALMPERPRPSSGRQDKPTGTGAVEWDENGRVIDGRDAWLSVIAFHAVHDALDAGRALDAVTIARIVWDRFLATTDLSRGRGGGATAYHPADAVQKVRDKLRLARDGRLPPRQQATVEPEYVPPELTATEARDQLGTVLGQFCADAAAFHFGESFSAPMRGIRATVGLGKSRVAQRYLSELSRRLKAEGRPWRVLVLVPSHSLAEEVAGLWRADGTRVAVLRGYERNDPITGAPMCQDIEAVRAAQASRCNVQKTICTSNHGRPRCRYFEVCLKQQNRRDVAAADVVVAPYDALVTGFTHGSDKIGVMLIDEGCWARSVEDLRLFVDDFATEPVSDIDTDRVPPSTGSMADLADLRHRAQVALSANGPGALRRQALTEAGLTADTCFGAMQLEYRRRKEARLRPNLAGARRAAAFATAQRNGRIWHFAAFWQAMSALLQSENEVDGRITILQPDKAGRSAADLRRIASVHNSLVGIPILHLDATLRPELANAILPGLEVTVIDAAAPHMHTRLVVGSFGKSMLCPEPDLPVEEVNRRANRLRECVDYVRWQARRVAPGSVLLVTYLAIEEAFSGIAGVETAHFNAIAGLDGYRDVRLLIVIGRPLPPSPEVEALCGAFFGIVPIGRYHKDIAGIRMQTGGARGVRVIRHADDAADILRAAICDDEVIQAIGRGRGVNRTAECPLEVQVLADVALPLVHDGLTPWPGVRPDIFQRMLLAGIAVDSPGDAAVLHPGMFGNAHAAKMTFARAAFTAQNPIRDTYREMCPKSAAYRRAGRGRSWQRAYWLDGEADMIRRNLEIRLGALGGWLPD